MIRFLRQHCDWDALDLLDYNIGPYDYQHRNRQDDFLELMEHLVGDYQKMVFATPVYWYAMSGLLKNFFDRITDLLDMEKELGRKLRGKGMAVMSSSNGDHLNEAFWLPFQATANYLGMHFCGGLHTVSNEYNEREFQNYIHLVESNL